MLQLNFEPPARGDELEIYLRGAGSNAAATIAAPASSQLAPLTLEQATRVRSEAHAVFAERSVIEYLTELVRATRERSGIASGASVRAGLQLLSAAKGLAYIRGREYVLPADIAAMAAPALAHRLCFSDEDASTRRRLQLMGEIIESVKAPR